MQAAALYVVHLGHSVKLSFLYTHDYKIIIKVIVEGMLTLYMWDCESSVHTQRCNYSMHDSMADGLNGLKLQLH